MKRRLAPEKDLRIADAELQNVVEMNCRWLDQLAVYLGKNPKPYACMLCVSNGGGSFTSRTDVGDHADSCDYGRQTFSGGRGGWSCPVCCYELPVRGSLPPAIRGSVDRFKEEAIAHVLACSRAHGDVRVWKNLTRSDSRSGGRFRGEASQLPNTSDPQLVDPRMPTSGWPTACTRRKPKKTTWWEAS